MLVGEGQQPRALREVSSPQEVMAGSQAIMQGRDVHGGIVRGQWRGFQQGRSHSRRFAPILFWRHGAWGIFCFSFHRLHWF